MMARMPKSSSVQGACSRLEPLPKLRRAEDRGAPVGRLVEHEVGILDSLGVVKIAALVKEMHAEALAVDRKQELLRDDLVGVDVGGVERSGNARQSRELFHFCMPPQM